MSRHSKGRRHRKVNMTPRPVGPRRSPRGVREQVSAGVVDSRATRAEPPAPARETSGERAEAVSRTVSASGLSRHAVRTWERLAEAGSGGIEVEELTEAVGFRRSTVLGHLKGLAGLGLAEDHESVWRATGPVEGAASREGTGASAGSVS
ncbi:hypothetical protein [Streptomyces triticiradicis]|uniref:Helix-turn-helix domain-containing protein n=1 Tax=Streptomyces triticiradicis TaxID=2651189 RepID=A0A7J5DAS1_9ACTN|nr:hypothetical protein [Streptomyces triticiradicis]KAB1985879.1 hypothetical protein F8144_25360 [Streptomyces triticiradicis]